MTGAPPSGRSGVDAPAVVAAEALAATLAKIAHDGVCLCGCPAGHMGWLVCVQDRMRKDATDA